MSKYLLKTGLNIRLAEQSIDYNVVGSIVTFEEIENVEIRERFIKSFLEEGYIVEVDGKEPVEDEKPSDKDEDKTEDSSNEEEDEELGDLEEENTETDDDESEEEEAPKKANKKATKVRGGKA